MSGTSIATGWKCFTGLCEYSMNSSLFSNDTSKVARTAVEAKRKVVMGRITFIDFWWSRCEIYCLGAANRANKTSDGVAVAKRCGVLLTHWINCGPPRNHH